MRGADAEDPGFQGAENEENERRKLKLQRQLEKLRAENEEKERRKLKLQRQIKRVKNAGNLAEAPRISRRTDRESFERKEGPNGLLRS